MSLRSPVAALAVAALAVALIPRPARAHGVLAEIDRRHGAVAVRLRYHDGPPLADARYEIRSPRGGDAPFAEGRTDRHGWVAFTPDAVGTWKVRIADATGHGKVVDVKIDSLAAAAAPPSAPAAEPPTVTLGGPGGPGAADPERGGGTSYTLRVLAAATAIVVVFRVLLTIQRSRRAKGR